MSSFILAPPSAPLPPSQDLHLLPFSLTPKPTTAPVSAYFRPRPPPTGHAFEGTGAQIAAFRGRQIVGQAIDVPKGYRGVVLRADAPPRSSSGGPGVLTPATSIASSSATSRSASMVSITDVEESASGRTTRAATRQKGAAQVALSRPRALRRGARTQKFSLDDEEEEEERPAKRRAVQTEREKTPIAVPVINVVPSSPAPGSNTITHPNADDEDEVMAREVDLSTPADSEPAPEPKPEAQDDTEEIGMDALTRVLVPTASFARFTLWTPDAPLAGFRADESTEDTTGEAKPEKMDTDTDEAEASREAKEAAAQCDSGAKLERGWWRQGGAGEGGDEFVRALGEWLGLNEIIHEPTYLNDMDNDEEGC